MILFEDFHYPLIRINTPVEIDFLTVHQLLIDEYGFVWFGKKGNRGLSQNLYNCIKQHKVLLIRDSKINNYKTYLCTVQEISSHKPTISIPMYYHQFNDLIIPWFKVTNIKEIDKHLIEEKFSAVSSDIPLKRTLSKSMCPFFYIKPKKNIEI